MYSVSNAVKTALLAGAVVEADIHILTQADDELTIQGDKIIWESFYIDRTASRFGEMPFGSAASNELGFQLRNGDHYFDDYDLSDARIDVSFYTYVNGTRTRVCDGGRFYVVKHPAIRDVISVTAYGCLVKADKVSDRAGDGDYYLHFYDILTHEAATSFGSGSSVDYSAVSALASQIYSGFYYPSGKDVTSRMLFGWVAALCGAMVREHGNADTIQLVRSQSTGIVIDQTNRFLNGTYDDEIEITGVSLKGLGSNVYTNGSQDYALEIKGNGVFEQLENSSTGEDYRQTVANALGNSLNGFTYYPCTFDIMRLVFLEPGDGIQFRDRNNNLCGTTLTRVHITLSSVRIEASGQSYEVHALSSAQPSSIKRGSVSGEMMQTDALKSRNYKYSSGDFSDAGTFFDLKNGMFRSTGFAIDSGGNAHFAGSVMTNDFSVVPNVLGYIDEGFITSDNEYSGGHPFLVVSDAAGCVAQYRRNGVYLNDGVYGEPLPALYVGTVVGKLILSDDIYLSDNTNSKLKDRLGGGGGEPAEYLKRATYRGNTLTITKKDGTTVVYTPNFDSRYLQLSGGTVNGVLYLEQLQLQDSGGEYFDAYEAIQDNADAISDLQNSVSGKYSLYGGNLMGSLTIGYQNDAYGLFPNSDNWNTIGLSNKRWYKGYINNLYVGSNGTDVNSRLLALEGGTCLIEGTKILMADGSEKNIEDVKTGDLIQSFDITTGKPVEAMCLMTRYTGAAVQYDALVFDDGSSAEFYGTHSIYCSEIRRLKEVGKWEVGLHSLDTNGNPIELSIKTKTKHHARPKHYILISSNNLYYANGILMGHLTSTKYQETEGLGMPKGITDRYKARLKDSDDEDQMALRPEFLSKAKAIMAEKHKLTADCEKEQALLDGTDYSVIKTCERFLAAFRNINLLNLAKSLGEIRDIIGDMGEARREEIRGKLSLKKDRLSEVTKQYNAFRSEYRKKIKLSKFEDSVTQGNEDLPALKEWAKTIQKKNK